MRRLVGRVIVASTLFAGGLSPRAVLACASVQSSATPVPVASEEALILWDAGTQTEQFIRHAQFRGGGEGMGFLVPTPTRPELAEVAVDPFPALEQSSLPREIWVDERRVVPGCVMLLSRGAGGLANHTVAVSAVPPVRVLEEHRVGPYDATILAADDPSALAQWLGAHGFAARPAITEWLRPYVAEHWLLTAFRLAPPGAAGGNALPAVRLTFHSDLPFYPYSEPREVADVPGAPRSLAVFVVAEAGYEAGRGVGFAPWSAASPFVAPADGAVDNERARTAIAGVRAAGLVVPATPWLSVFRDETSPRLADLDLFFRRRRSNEPVRPPPLVRVRHHDIPIPLECVLPVFVVCALAWTRWRRRKRRSEEIGSVYRRGRIDP